MGRFEENKATRWSSANSRGRKHNRLCIGSTLHGCDQRPRAKDFFDSKLFCSIIPIRTYPEKLKDREKSENYAGGDESDLFMQLRNFDYIKIYMNE